MKKLDLISTVTMETGSVEIPCFQIVSNIRIFTHVIGTKTRLQNIHFT